MLFFTGLIWDPVPEKDFCTYAALIVLTYDGLL